MGEGVGSRASRAEGVGTFVTDEANAVDGVVDDVVDSPTDDMKKGTGTTGGSDPGNGDGPADQGPVNGGRVDAGTDGSGPVDSETVTPPGEPAPAAGDGPPEATPDSAAEPAPHQATPPPAEAPPPVVEETAFGAVGTAAVPHQSRNGSADVTEPAEVRTDEWSHPGDWAVTPQPGELVPAPADYPHGAVHHDDGAYGDAGVPDDELDDEEWADEYDDVALLSAIFSAPSLALAAFVFALTGLLGGMIPESLPYLVQLDPTNGPAYHVRIVGLIALGFAIVAASLGLAAMLRSIGSPLRWPRYLGGAAVLLALLIALQSVLLIVLAWLAPAEGGMN